jgi:hypothetical protein
MRQLEKAAKPPKRAQTGWSLTDVSVGDHPVRSKYRRLRGVFLMSRPPLLARRGMSPTDTRSQFIHRFIERAYSFYL